LLVVAQVQPFGVVLVVLVVYLLASLALARRLLSRWVLVEHQEQQMAQQPMEATLFLAQLQQLAVAKVVSQTQQLAMEEIQVLPEVLVVVAVLDQLETQL
jgi:hypothetical protein